jgi:NAD+ synthase
MTRRLHIASAAPPAEPDLSLDLAATTRILSGFIKAEVERTGKRKVVLGLSGGIDSALAATLAADALGPSGVVAVVMPYKTSSASSLSDAEAVIGSLGIVAEKFDISEMVDAFAAKSGAVGERRLGNVMARVRMLVLYDRSMEHDALVLGTSNKTELLLGYGTIHGDLASALNPLGDLYKTQVRALSKALHVPKPILAKAPSADLWPAQTDERELGFSYGEADRILALLVDARLSSASVVRRGFASKTVRRIQSLIVRSQYKRRQPVIAKVSTRSVGWDFRYPRDWRS